MCMSIQAGFWGLLIPSSFMKGISMDSNAKATRERAKIETETNGWEKKTRLADAMWLMDPDSTRPTKLCIVYPLTISSYQLSIWVRLGRWVNTLKADRSLERLLITTGGGETRSRAPRENDSLQSAQRNMASYMKFDLRYKQATNFNLPFCIFAPLERK